MHIFMRIFRNSGQLDWFLMVYTYVCVLIYISALYGKQECLQIYIVSFIRMSKRFIWSDF